MNIEEFYEADERRRRSEEIEVGTEWLDRDGVRHEVSWVADTGELSSELISAWSVRDRAPARPATATVA